MKAAVVCQPPSKYGVFTNLCFTCNTFWSCFFHRGGNKDFGLFGEGFLDLKLQTTLLEALYLEERNDSFLTFFALNFLTPGDLGQPKSICYRDLNFDPNSFEKFLQIFQDTAQLFAPLEKKIIRLTIKSLWTKAFKNIMIRSKLQNKYSKNMR